MKSVYGTVTCNFEHAILSMIYINNKNWCFHAYAKLDFSPDSVHLLLADDSHEIASLVFEKKYLAEMSLKPDGRYI